MIEALKLLTEHEVLQGSWTPGPDLQTQLVLDRSTPVGGHVSVRVVAVQGQTRWNAAARKPCKGTLRSSIPGKA
jgi:hypothetical protein